MGTSGGDSVVLKRLIYPPNGNCENDIKTIGYGSNRHVYFSYAALPNIRGYEDEFKDRFCFPYGQIAIDTRDRSNLILGCSRLPADSSYRLLSSRSTNRRFPRWTEELTQNPLNPFVTVKFASPGSNIVYAMTSSGILYRKKFDSRSPLDTEAGKLDTILNGWIQRDRLDPESPILNFDINKYTDSIIYAVSKNAFYASTNRGKSWNTHTNRLHVDNYYMVLANPIDKKEIFISTSDGVYSTTTGGFSWRKLKGNLPNVKVLQIHIDHGFLYAATYGRGLWRTPLFKSQNSEIRYDARLSVQKIKCIKAVEAFGAGDPEDLFGYIKVANHSLKGRLTDITDYELWKKQDNDAIHVKQGSFKGIHQFDYSPQEWKGLTFADLASLCFTLAIKISDGENFPFGNAEYFCKNCCSDPYYEFNMGNYPPIIEGIQSMPASVHYQPVKMYGDDFFEVDLYENGDINSSHLRLFGKLELKIQDPSNGR